MGPSSSASAADVTPLPRITISTPEAKAGGGGGGGTSLSATPPPSEDNNDEVDVKVGGGYAYPARGYVRSWTMLAVQADTIYPPELATSASFSRPEPKATATGDFSCHLRQR